MLKFTASDYDEIRRHGEETYPDECCGILLGTVDGGTRIVRSIVRCRNTRTDAPQQRYHIDPRELVRAQRDGRDRGLEVIGFYHSHPDHPARPSPTDLEEAHWIGCSYAITTVEKGRATVTASFVLTGSTEEDKAFAEEKIVVANCD